MDSLLVEMRKSENSYLRILMMVLAVMAITGTVVGLGVLYYSIWQTDHVMWRLAMGRVDTAITHENYTEARREIDEFISLPIWDSTSNQCGRTTSKIQKATQNLKRQCTMSLNADLAR